MILESPDRRDGQAEVPVGLRLIEKLNRDAEYRWRDRLSVQSSLTRSLVSFQANKGRPVYRWYKYKESFSAGLVEYLLAKYGISGGALLDLFAGIGTALFAAAEQGIRAEGIELLPIGRAVIGTKQLIDRGLGPQDVNRLVFWRDHLPWCTTDTCRPINELRITRGAYPAETLGDMGRFLSASANENDCVRTVLSFALLCILESTSYTRKDGQYLRWDWRSGRRQGQKAFDKGHIVAFDQAMVGKLAEIISDLPASEHSNDLFTQTGKAGDVILHAGSCLDLLPKFPDGGFDCLMTSPPYCNRYDYTRTYALELAMLGVDEAGLADLRQRMLSCTVENRAKDLPLLNPAWVPAVAAADGHELLQSILAYLESQKQLELLNNNGIPRMVRGYVYEMACVIAECSRVLKRGAPLIMVNDNVRYAGASISMDIILSEIAEKLGFDVETILVLPTGKGNSSQQMGAHGRESLRKCVYVWRKT
jgi:DNA modification methylase